MIEAKVDANGLAERVLLTGDSHEAMRSADAAMLASGPRRLRRRSGRPDGIVYRVSAITLCVMRGVVRLGLIESETVGLPNLILGREVVPELRQSRASAAGIAREARASWTTSEAARGPGGALGGRRGRLRWFGPWNGSPGPSWRYAASRSGTGSGRVRERRVAKGW